MARCSVCDHADLAMIDVALDKIGMSALGLKFKVGAYALWPEHYISRREPCLVGDTRFERVTSSLSGTRSNQLS